MIRTRIIILIDYRTSKRPQSSKKQKVLVHVLQNSSLKTQLQFVIKHIHQVHYGVKILLQLIKIRAQLRLRTPQTRPRSGLPASIPPDLTMKKRTKKLTVILCLCKSLKEKMIGLSITIEQRKFKLHKNFTNFN